MESWPDECPLFRWHGRICEAVEVIGSFGMEMRDPLEGEPKGVSWPWAIAPWIEPNGLTPLTPSARDMLAIAIDCWRA